MKCALTESSFSKVEPRRRLADLGEIELRRRLLLRHHVIVAVAPAQAHQVGVHRFRQIAHVAPFVHGQRAVALGELLAVVAVDQRHVRELRRRPAHGLEDRDLPGGVGQVIVAADDVGDAHVVIVDHDREHVGRLAVGAQQHEIVDVARLDAHRALHQVLR